MTRKHNSTTIGRNDTAVMGPGGAYLESGDRIAPPDPYRPFAGEEYAEANPPCAAPAIATVPYDELIAAQRMACTALLGGCGEALFAVRCQTGEAKDPRDVRVGLLSAALLEEILTVWRDTLTTLETASVPAQSFY